MRHMLLRGALFGAVLVSGASFGLAQTSPANPQPPENTVTGPTPSQAGQDPSMAKTPGSDAAPGMPAKVVDPESTTNLAPEQQPINNDKPRIAGQKVPSSEHDSAAHNTSVAEHDKQPIITHTFNFTDEQRQVIIAALAGEKGSAVQVENLQESTVLPRGLELKSLPDSVSRDMPWVARYKYVKVGGKTVLVEPNLHYVAVVLQ